MFLGFTIGQWLSFGFVSALINLGVSQVLYSMRNRRRALSTLAAIEFECDFAVIVCKAYRKSSNDGTKAWAPAYRLSIDALQHGVAWLRDHEFLITKEARELTRLCLRMEEVNRCLDLVDEGVKQNKGNEEEAHHFWSRQSERCAAKCRHVLEAVGEEVHGTVPGATDVLKAARGRIRLWLRPISWHRDG